MCKWVLAGGQKIPGQTLCCAATFGDLAWKILTEDHDWMATPEKYPGEHQIPPCTVH